MMMLQGDAGSQVKVIAPEKVRVTFNDGVTKITNLHSKPIVAYRISWTYQDGRDKTTTHTADAWPEKYLAPAGGFTTVPRRLSKVSVVNLDGVLFSDGVVAGANRFKLDQYIRTSREAARYLAEGLRDRMSSPDEAAKWLAAVSEKNQNAMPRDLDDGADPAWKGMLLYETAESFAQIARAGNMDRLRSIVRETLSGERGTQ